MYEVKIPIAFDRLLVKVVPALSRVGLASLGYRLGEARCLD